MYNKVSCALSNRTIEAYDNEELTIFFSAVSNDCEIGKINTPLPFILDVKFEEGFVALDKKSKKDFRRLAYFILKELSPTVITMETKEELKFKYGLMEHPTESDIDFIVNALSSFPYEKYDVTFVPSSCSDYSVSIIPFIADKKQFNIFKENDFNINHFINTKEDLYKFACNSGYTTSKIIKNKDPETAESEVYFNIIKEALRTNNFKNIESNLLGETFHFQYGIFKGIGLYGRGKKSMNSFDKMINIYWTLYKMIYMNVNMSQSSNPYPHHLTNDNLIKYHEKVLQNLKETLNKD
jgi:hypothetical protein